LATFTLDSTPPVMPSTTLTVGTASNETINSALPSPVMSAAAT
jgi:hypothetical protein